MDLQEQEHSELHIHNTAFVLPFSTLNRDSLAGGIRTYVSSHI